MEDNAIHTYYCVQWALLAKPSKLFLFVLLHHETSLDLSVQFSLEFLAQWVMHVYLCLMACVVSMRKLVLWFLADWLSLIMLIGKEMIFEIFRDFLRRPCIDIYFQVSRFWDQVRDVLISLNSWIIRYVEYHLACQPTSKKMPKIRKGIHKY